MKKVMFVLTEELYTESYRLAQKLGFSHFSEYIRLALREKNQRSEKDLAKQSTPES